MRHRIYVHLCWTTRDRAALIDYRVARFLERFLASVARQERSQVLAVGIVATHIHLLLRLHPTTSIPRLVQRLKGGSSVLATRNGHCAGAEPLRWEKGYNIHTVSGAAVNKVARYVETQAHHHPGEAIPGWRSARSGFDVASATSAEWRLQPPTPNRQS
jgi:REP element-mobilizing transposase RayT